MVRVSVLSSLMCFEAVDCVKEEQVPSKRRRLAIIEGPCDMHRQLKCCQLLHNCMKETF